MNERFFELPAKKQRDMINGSLKVFSEWGYRRASMDAIAKNAGVSKSLLFHYFGCKKELYLFLCDYSEKFVIREMRNSQDWSETDCFLILNGIMQTRLRLLNVFPDIFKFIDSIHSEKDSEVIDELRESIMPSNIDEASRLMPLVDTSRFEEGVDAERLVRLAVWFSDGFLKSHMPVTPNRVDAISREYNQYLKMLRMRFYRDEQAE